MIEWIDMKHPKRPAIGDKVIIRWRWYERIYFDVDIVEGWYHGDYRNSCLITKEKEALFTDNDFFDGENLITHWAILNEPEIIIQRNANPSYLFHDEYKYELLSVSHKENNYNFVIEFHNSKIYTESIVSFKGDNYKVKMTNRTTAIGYLSNYRVDRITIIYAEKV